MPPSSPNHPTTPVSNTTTEFEFPLLFSLPHRTRSSHEDDLGIDDGKRGIEREGTEMERVIRQREKDGYRFDVEQRWAVLEQVWARITTVGLCVSWAAQEHSKTGPAG
ncbi:hypothetical protein Droror1_Dr00000400 [Drosera rotundifolia]